MSDETEFDWTDEEQVAGVIPSMFTVCWAEALRRYEGDGRLRELLDGFVAGRFELKLGRDGLTVLETVEVPAGPSMS